ncbi:hypothetical protein [Antarctobacter heliothermus]|uniref:Uncharacterized protein n=1 Tax=Antarctobacter heliothermus TaxID=74033 RepID=A0A239IXW1_9RHOB|nr:hypothetical protein [Antarctobacter heliothermus]SNS98058.1 hypothetical protein SAMN04488078_104645 [Antarctobacter heliothermus]
MKILTTLTAALAIWTTVAGGATAQNCDSKGSNWQGRIDIGSTIYGFELRRLTCATDSMWNYYVWTTSTRWEGTATVDKAGTNLSVVTVTGGLAGCSLSGTWYPRDVINARPYRGNGSANCGGGGSWSANIR